MKIGKTIPKWVELKGKIGPDSSTKDNINEAPLTWSVLPRENRVMKIKKFHGAVQSNNAIFAGFKHTKL